MKKIEYNRDIKRKWMLLVICFLALLIIIFGCQSSKLKKIDKEPPVIELYSDTIEITEGDEYSPGDNVKSVKDNVDGDITKVDNNLNETGKAYYFIDSSKLDTSKVGEYSVKVIARDKAENESTKEFIVQVNAKNDDSGFSSSNNYNNDSDTSKGSSASGSKNNLNSSSENSENLDKENISSGDNNFGTTSNNKQQKTCKTVHHDATGHNETIWVQDSAAWDESYVVCICGAKFNSNSQWLAHMNEYLFTNDEERHKNFHVETIHHEATGHNETKWIEDSAALDETICN